MDENDVNDTLAYSMYVKQMAKREGKKSLRN